MAKVQLRDFHFGKLYSLVLVVEVVGARNAKSFSTEYN